jgi:integrase
MPGSAVRETPVPDESQEPTLESYLHEWLERRTSQLRPTTWASYRQLITAYLVPWLGGRHLSELDRRVLEACYVKLLSNGGRGGRGLSVRTVQYVHSVLHCALQDAVIDGLLDVNPARNARAPKHHPDQEELADERPLWTEEQTAAFLAFVADHPWQPLWQLALGTGARRGELLGLRWSDVDLDGAQVTIQRALSVVDGVPRLLGTKTSRGRRLAIGASVVEALRRQAQAQQHERERAPSGDDRWDLVFTDGLGGPIDPMEVTKEFRRLVRRAPVPVVRLHDLRHLHASLLLQRGLPMKVVSERLGHSTIMVTIDVYGHVLPAMDAEAAAEIEAVFNETPGTNST